MFKIKINKLENTEFTNTGYFQQTPFWSLFKQDHGWKYTRFLLEIEYPQEDEDEHCEKSSFVKPIEKIYDKNKFLIFSLFS